MTSDRPLRIACVTETYPPEVNGVAVTLARVVEGLVARGHVLDLLRPCQADETATGDRPVSVDGLLLHRLPGLPIPGYRDLRMGLPAARRLRRLWRIERPDIVHIATEGPLGESALRAARSLGLPVSSDFRTNFDAYSDHYGIGFLRRPITAWLRHFHNRCDATMAPTEALRHTLADQGYRQLHVVTRGVDTERFQPARRSDALRAQWGAGADDVVVLHVGRVAAEKNLAVLSAAFEAIAAQVPGARLVVVGDGPQRGELQARHPDVVFTGQQRGDDLARHYASADLFVFASLTETFGNVTTEAMASGLAIAAYDHAAAGQLVEPGVEGLLAAPGDERAFVAQALSLARDLPRCRAMGRHARQRAEGLGWDAIVARFEAILRGTIAARETATAPQTARSAVA
ncbi:glycosyltransferase family 4 protein [Sphaerotilus mobilis]|uniref:Glycosyltransferase involved in cell wall biosynthesis n=1 Tax=Sphaerotilus mobilis TaxID=47994 RepID=A0A4Q7LTY7_9BURK|nr:glycosyltransferase family 1 protein [Sphaerotilus mobilis]RZS58506.1 glycosyltransferase involved in cell wall biosynthesis [Sphaerotilus mobilis]